MLDKKPVLVILSVLIAIFLWIYVTGQIDPNTRLKLSNIGVRVVGEDVLASGNLAVLTNNDLNISVTINGKRSAVNQAKNGAVTATVDVSKAREGENSLEIKYDTPAGISIDSSSPASCNVTVEPLASKELPVEISFTDSRDSEVEPWLIDVSPKSITVSGSKSEIKRITTIHGEVSFSEMSREAKNLKIQVEALDEGRNLVDGVTYSQNYVKATVQLLEVKNVPLKFKAKGLDKDFELGPVTGVSEIRVLGDDKTLASLDHIDAYVDLSDVKKGGVVSKPFEVKLPNNVYLFNKNFKDVKVTVRVAN